MIGAYAYNGCYSCAGGGFNWLCCGRREWSVGGCFNCDSIQFTHELWREGSALRSRFEDELASPAMTRALDEAPLVCTMCCGGCKSVENMSPCLNATWVPDVNARVLNPAGFSCKAYHWITYNDKGQRTEHMAIAVSTLPVPTVVAPGEHPPPSYNSVASSGAKDGWSNMR